jgi:hypothetical protein
LGILPFLPRKLVESLTSPVDSFPFRPSARCDICAPYTLASGPLDLIVEWFPTSVDRRHLSTFSGMDSHTLSNVTYLVELCELSSLAFAKESCNYSSSYFLASISAFFLAISIWHLIVCIFLDDPVAIEESPSFERLLLDNVFWINRSLDCLPLPELLPVIELSLDVISRYSGWKVYKDDMMKTTTNKDGEEKNRTDEKHIQR